MTPLQQNAAQAYLIIEQNRRWSDVYRLIQDQPTIMGRSSSCQIVIPDDRSSRHHAQIEFQEKDWVLQDLGSRNGTQVNGSQLSTPYCLQDGDQIQIGGSVLRFTFSLASASTPPVSGHSSGAAKTPEVQATADLTDAARRSADPLIVQRGTPRRWVTEMSVDMLACPTVAEAAELALEVLTKRCGNQAGAIFLTDGEGLSKVLATRERPGKAYHRISDFLVKTCQTEKRAILARNIQDDQKFVDVGSSLSQQSSSVICVPIFDAQGLIGLVHLYSRHGEPDLTAQTLEDVSAAAEALSVTIPHMRERGRLQRKLQLTRRRVHHLEQQLEEVSEADQILGNSPALQKLRSQLGRVAVTHATVLLRGESGVGKELAARQIHLLSSRKTQPFVAVNCAALTSSLLESELFGHEKGAFTGATEQKMGKFEMANGGTLMLDEVGEMSAETQAKFLRILEGQPFERVGGSKPIAVDVRIVAATNRDLELAVKENAFRADLYFRLRVVEIFVPSLRDRREDIVPLAESFLARFRAKSGYGPQGFSQRAKSAMQDYHWPGNIRELKNSVERAFVLSNHELAEPEDLALSNIAGQGPTANNSVEPPAYREKTLAEIEEDHIKATLEYTNGQKSRAATILGIERSTLDRKLKRFDPDQDQPSQS